MRTKSFWVGLFTVLSASLASAAPITIPPDLAPGSTYFLAFVTAGTHDALSSNIADYDAFVTAEANSDLTLAALGTTWKVIGSTATVDAITHIGVTGPVYNLSGQIVATGSLDMFDGTLVAPIEYNQNGLLQSSYVWTGTLPTGIEDSGLGLGTTFPEDSRIGQSSKIDSQWITEHVENISNNHAFYGISGPLVVTTAVPEPSTISLMLSPAFLLLGTLRRRRNRPAKPPSPRSKVA
jgi:hypothetical protein